MINLENAKQNIQNKETLEKSNVLRDKLNLLFDQLNSQNEESQKQLSELLKSELFLEYCSNDEKNIEIQELLLKIRNKVVLFDYTKSVVSELDRIFNLNPCHHLVAQGKLKEITEFLKFYQPSIRVPDGFGYIPLYDAIMNNSEDIIQFHAEKLMITPTTNIKINTIVTSQEGSGINESNSDMYISLLHSVVVANDIIALKKIKQLKEINLFCTDDSGDWPIHDAIHHGRLELIPLLYDPKMKEIPDTHGNFLVHRIYSIHNPNAILILKKLIELGEDINKVSQQGCTLLSETIFMNFENEVSKKDSLNLRILSAQELLKLGANINQIASYGGRFNIEVTKSSTPIEISFMNPDTNEKLNLKFTVTITFPNVSFESEDFKMKSGRTVYNDMMPQISITPNYNLPQEFITPIVQNALKQIIDLSSRQENFGLLHQCLVQFPHHSNTEKEKGDVEYSLNMMNFLIKNGLDLDIIDISNYNALQLAKAQNLPGAISLLEYHFNKFNTARETLLKNETTLNTPCTALVMQYLYSKSDIPELENSNTNTQTNLQI